MGACKYNPSCPASAITSSDAETRPHTLRASMVRGPVLALSSHLQSYLAVPCSVPKRARGEVAPGGIWPMLRPSDLPVGHRVDSTRDESTGRWSRSQQPSGL